MHREGPSSIFTIYFNGQFWVGTIERIEGSELSAAHVVFGAEPSNEQALQFVIEKWGELRFSPKVKTEQKKESGNPKRRQREAALAAAKATPSTKAQQAIAKMREQNKAAAQKESAAARREASAWKRSVRANKRKNRVIGQKVRPKSMRFA